MARPIVVALRLEWLFGSSGLLTGHGEREHDDPLLAYVLTRALS